MIQNTLFTHLYNLKNECLKQNYTKMKNKSRTKYSLLWQYLLLQKKKNPAKKQSTFLIIYFLKIRVVCDIFWRNVLYIGIVPLGILHVGNFIQREFSLHLLHMNYMICRWIPCKGNHLNPAQSINITRMWFYVKPRLLRGSLIVVLKDTVCKHTLRKIALKLHIFMCVSCQMWWLSLVT